MLYDRRTKEKSFLTCIRFMSTVNIADFFFARFIDNAIEYYSV